MDKTIPVPLTASESGRLSALESYKALKDFPETELDALTKLASFICQTPISLISFIDSNRQLFKSRHGINVKETPLEISFCKYTILNDGIFIIEDALLSEEFKNNPFVTADPNLRFYAGVPLKTPDGYNIGTLCVIDKIPRILTDEQKDALKTIAQEAIAKLELCKKNQLLDRQLQMEQEKKMQTTLDDLSDYKYALDKTSMVSITDPLGVISYVNDKFCEISGYAPDELIGRDHLVVNLAFHSKEVMKGLWSAVVAGKVYQSELKSKAKDGTYFWTSTNIFPFFDRKGIPYKYLTISYDITQKKLQEQQLIEVKVLAEKLSRSKDIFLTNVSHEIRTPLNAITGLGKLLSKTELNTQQKQYLDGIESASENLLSIVNDLLDFSKIEAGKITLENISFNLETITQQAVNILTHKTEEKGLDLTFEIDPKIAPVLIGDPFRINQVFMNMLGNAIKFTEKGHIALKASLIEQTDNSQKILVNIEDTGVGINEEYLSGIFDKFTQEDATVVRKFGGTGLGMSITKELTELMGGTISVASKKNEGTSISLVFTFKIGTARVLEKKRTIINNTGNISGKRILLVEDNNLNRLLANTILTGYGAIVVEAVNGFEGVELVRKENFDIILMDVQMPVMDGVQATQIIRAEINKTVPIIALTANAIKGKLDQYIDIGMDDFIFKPYDEIKLVNPIAKWLNKSAVDVLPRVEKKEIKEIKEPVENKEVPKIKEEKVKEEKTIAEDKDNKGEKLYDLGKLLGMVRDNDDFLMRMLNLFINEVPVSAKKITSSYENGDFDSVKYYAHLIRPSITNLGINSIKNEVLQIELLAQKNEKTPELTAMVQKVDKIISTVVEQIRSEYNI